MSRTDIRALTRDVQNATKIINKFTPNQRKVIDQIVEGRSNEQAKMAIANYLRVITASLYEHGFRSNQLDSIFELAEDFINEESIKSIKLDQELKRSGNIEMVKKKIEEEILREINTLMDAGKNRKEVIEAVLFKFPNMSKAMVINAYQQAKDERESEKIKEDPEIKQAVEYIFEEEKEIDKKVEKTKSVVVKNATAPQPDVKENKTTEKHVEEDITIVQVSQKKEEVEVKGLKVIEEKVVKSVKVEGENGTYEAETGKGVILSKENRSVNFRTEKELDEWVAEFRQVFAMIKA
jgi:hypothetical protein